jgi:tetratricopeptide (TPR) repeat protein
VLLDSGRVDESMKLLEQSVEIGRRTRDPGDPALLRSMNDLGQNLIRKGDMARAMPLIAEAERGMVAQKGADAPETLQFSTSYAVLLEKQGKLVDAIAKYQDVLARRQKVLPEEDISVLDASTNLGRALTKAKRFADAEQVLAKAEAVAATKRNPTSDARWNVTNQLLDTSTTWLATDPKAPVAARIPAAKAKVEELRAARTAAQPPLPTDWKRG